METTLQIDGRECRNQHDLMMAVLLAAGACDAEELKPKDVSSQIADAIFEDEGWIIEIKTIEADRTTDPKVLARAGAQFDVDCRKFDGPIVFGQVVLSLDEMPRPVAHNLLRRIGGSVQKAVENANKQIKATKRALNLPDARGCVALVSPHFDLTPDAQRWLITDAIRDSRLSSIEAFMLCQSTMLANFGRRTFDSGIQFYDRTYDRMPMALKERIGSEWARVHRNKMTIGLAPERRPRWKIQLG